MARLSRQESRELTRQRLREAALVEFERHGVAAASIDRITEAAGYSRGAFYANYDSRFDLALELWSETAERQTAHLEGVISSTGNPGRMLDQMRINYDLLVKEKVWSALNVEVRLEAARNPEFQGHLRARDQIVFDHLRQMLSRLCEAAGCAGTADIDYIAFVLQSFTQGLRLDGVNSSKASPGALLVRLLLDLMGRPPGLKPIGE